MSNMRLELKNFFFIREATLESKNNLIVLLAPNRCGKTHILKLLYSIYWSFWKSKKDREDFKRVFPVKAKKVFLIKDLKEFVTWGKEAFFIGFENHIGKCIVQGSLTKGIQIKSDLNSQFYIEKSPVYIYVPGLGDFYRGIFSIKKYYPNWNIVSEAITDFIEDLVIVSDLSEQEVNKEYREILKKIEESFQVKFYVQNKKINISEQNKTYSLEKTASGLKTIAWLYLLLKYQLVGEFLLIDEPENSLHPEYITKLTKILFYLSKITKIVIATHSDYFLESLNFLIKKYELKVDVWYAEYEKEGVVYRFYEATQERLIDSSPLTKTFLKLVREIYGRKN